MPESPLPETSVGTSLLMPDAKNPTKPFHAYFTSHRHSHSIARQTFSLCTRITLKRSVVFCLRFACHPLLSIRWLSFLSIYANHLSLGMPHDDLLRKSVGTFLVHRASRRIRLHLLMDHFRIARQMLSLGDLRQLWKGGIVDMGVIEGRHERYTIALHLADHCGGRHEGMFAIQLARERDGFALWTASFIFAGTDEFGGSVIIGGMQGPKGEAAKQSLITATRCLAGLRPKDAVLLVLQGMAARSEASHLMAVSNARHAINQRRRKRRRMMLANLDAYWIDRGGQPCEPFGFSLPAAIAFPAGEISKREKTKHAFWEAGCRLIKGHGS